jgi:hypothetical protein
LVDGSLFEIITYLTSVSTHRVDFVSFFVQIKAKI